MIKHFVKINRNKGKLLTGFTLVELLVTLTIFSIMTGVVLVNQGKFNNTIFLSNLAHDIALTIRQAQTYGINVRETAQSSDLFSNYGVSFQMGANNKNFVIFADVLGTANGLFDGSFSCPGNDSECVERYVIKNSNYIKSICAGNDESDCTANSATTLNISFTRPDSDAHIKSNVKTTDQPYAKIVVASQDGANTKGIIVRSTGQIYVE